MQNPLSEVPDATFRHSYMYSRLTGYIIIWSERQIQLCVIGITLNIRQMVLNDVR